MLACPNGHANPAGRQLCEECDAFLVPADTEIPPRRRWWFAAGFGAVVAFLISGTVAAVVVNHIRSDAHVALNNEPAAIQDWWEAGADNHEAALQDALESAQRSLQQFDKLGIERSCQLVHDSSVVDLQSDLPSPDAELTAELDAAIQDAHTTAHVCISAISGSANNYDVEFRTYLDQALKHLGAAIDIVDKSRPEA
jgi:hypothetical protein